MAAVSPASNSSPSPASPSTPSPPPPVASTPPRLQSPPSNPSDPSTPTPSPPGPSSPPPSRQLSGTSPPPASGTPPPLTPALSPPPATPPPPPSHAPPPSTPDRPPPSATPPVSSTPPTPSNPPPNSPPPPAAEPPQTPPKSSSPPQNSPPPPPEANPPVNPPPPPQPTNPPEISPPTRPSAPPETSPPPPASIPPRNSPPPERLTPLSSPLKPLPPPSNLPPPPSLVSPPGPSGNRTDDGSVPNGGVNPNSNSNGIGTGGVIAVGVVAGIVVLSIVGFVVWYIRKPRRNDSGRGGYIMPSSMGSSPKSGSSLMKVHSTLHQDRHATGGGSGSANFPKELGGLGNSRSMFTYEELFKATSAFSAQNLLGEGGFGSVYKGYLPDGREVAVKKLKIGGGQGEQEFKAEVEIIGRVHHRHLVSLVGYCISEHRRLLVYDYVPNNSLHYHLHFKGDGQLVLDWERRAKIAAGAARGIAYLHEDCHPRIIHRDIKSSNILLDKNFEARVSDFGLAKLALDAETHITTRVVGTFGYVAPEYASSGKLTERSDVYSFGVVLLELITGRKAVDAFQPMGNESLVEWARPLLNHALDSQDFERLVDPRLEKNYVESEMLKMIGIAAACVRHASAKRPQMRQVVRAFDTLATTDLSNGMRFGESQAFDSGQKSAEAIFIRMLTFGNQDYSSGFYSQGSSNA